MRGVDLIGWNAFKHTSHTEYNYTAVHVWLKCTKASVVTVEVLYTFRPSHSLSVRGVRCDKELH